MRCGHHRRWPTGPSAGRFARQRVTPAERAQRKGTLEGPLGGDGPGLRRLFGQSEDGDGAGEGTGPSSQVVGQPQPGVF